MEIIDRYLHAVKFWLPKAQRDDIIAELSEDIRSQIEDKEAELGRKADDGDVAAILKKCGHPLLVAQRYLPQEHLIGPSIFPVYSFVLKIIALIYVLPWLVVWLGYVIFSPVYRAHDPIHSLGILWQGVASMVFAITLAFMFAERFMLKSWAQKDWDPRKLPAVRDSNQIPRFSSILDLTIAIAFIVWWAIHLRFRTVFGFSGATITLAPVWRYFLCGLLFVSAVTVGLSAVNLILRCWTRFTACVRLAIDCVGSMLFCWLLKTAILVEIAAPNVLPEKTLAVTNAINIWASRTFPAAVVLCLVIVLVDLRRIIRMKTTVTKLAPCVATADSEP
jgi:hypothetical protein